MLDALLLIVAAFLAGVINTVAGGGTLLTFPALLRFGRLSAVLANATSTVALVPGSIAGAWGFRRELAGTGPWLRLLLPPSLIGGAIGSLLVTRLPERYFATLVPWLLLTAALLFLLQPRLTKLLRSQREVGLPSRRVCAIILVCQFLVAIYGGYFGAGIGILMLTSLSFMGLGDIQRMNAVKAILGTAINGVSVIIFVIDDKVVWSLAALMAIGAIAGGYAGASVSRRIPKDTMRWLVILIGLGLAAYYFAKPRTAETSSPQADVRKTGQEKAHEGSDPLKQELLPTCAARLLIRGSLLSRFPSRLLCSYKEEAAAKRSGEIRTRWLSVFSRDVEDYSPWSSSTGCGLPFSFSCWPSPRA
jgi:hypothetical protein